MTGVAPPRARLLLLLPTTTYRADAFVDAAKFLRLDLTVASELPSAFQDEHPADLLTLDLGNPDAAVAAARAFAQHHPLRGVVGVDDDTAVVAACIAGDLGLPCNPLAAVRAARDKQLQRERLHAGGVPIPPFAVHTLDEHARAVAESVSYPCVLKPVSLSGSRGVIRADDPDAFVTAHARLGAILKAAELPHDENRFLVERYVPGPEYALEGIVVDGALHVLAVFDKPDPLDGPFFEETIYVTPSRAGDDTVRSLTQCAQQAVTALGLERGPVHIELRHNDNGPWLIEIAARPIGGKCGRTLRFGPDGDISLETVVLRQVVEPGTAVPPRETQAAGVMMIPIPYQGVLRGVDGAVKARAVPGVEDVVITAHSGQVVLPLPEGSRYLGFIFARGETPAFVEEALRAAHATLEPRIDPPD